MNRKLKNKKGVISEKYEELQGLPLLEQAKKASFITRKKSNLGIVKVLLQASEIAIQNLNDLLGRIISDFEKDKVSKAVIKLGWFKDINSLLQKITTTVNELNIETKNYSLKFISSTSSQKQNRKLIKELDKTIFKHINKKNIDINTLLERKNINNNLYRFFHLYRIALHEVMLWSKNFQNFLIPEESNYNDFIGFEFITKAVNEPKLKGDTFFTQFRCLHQIPELLTIESNEYIELAVKSLTKGKIIDAHKSLSIANVLLRITLNSLSPIINNLSQTDYHKIRENLGLTSGSHSVSLHYHLFRDLYFALSNEFISKYFETEMKYRKSIEDNYSLKILETELLALRNIINQWRSLHLHLPKTNLGENNTKSLIGSQEAVLTAEKMQQHANKRDPLNKIANIYSKDINHTIPLITSYLKSDKSFNTVIGKELGQITQKRFQKVQNRKGVFSNQIPFTPPPKRKV